MEIGNSINAYGRDPWVVRHGDTYYYCFYDSPQDQRLFVASSKTLSGLHNAPAVCIWQAPDSGPYSGHYWAPELYRIGERWYVYVAAGDRKEVNGVYKFQRMHVLQSVSTDPQGEYRYLGKIADAHDRWAIDGTLLSHQGKKYFIWSGWEDGQGSRQVLYIARMQNPLVLIGEGIKISTPEYEWEMRSQPYAPQGINEGPQILKRKGKVYLLYSASGSWTDDYCLGKLTLVGHDPLNPQHWKKHSEPVFSSQETLFAPGHASFVHDHTTRQHYIVYHASNRRGAGWNTHVRAQEFIWGPDHSPILGLPH